MGSKFLKRIFSIKSVHKKDKICKIISIMGNEINFSKKNYKKFLNSLMFYYSIKQEQSINKEKVLSKIENFTDYGILKEKRDQKLIVSLTSYPDRMYDIHYCLYSLLTQDLKPDEVILWLGKEQFPNREKDIPKKVLNLKENGLTIKWCEDIKSYKKLLPALEEYPNDIIVTADDDVFYKSDWLRKLYESYLESNKKTIITHRCHRIKFEKGEILPYKSWMKEITSSKQTFYNFPTGGSGVLYPPNTLYKDISNKELYTNIAPNADDIWFWAMAILNGTKIKTTREPNPMIYVNAERELNFNNDGTLHNCNVGLAQNDIQMQNLLKTYPQIKDILSQEKYVKVSVIVPVYNLERYLEKCLNSICNQTLKDIEIICVNDGSTDNSLKILQKFAQKDSRIIILDRKNSGAPSSRNAGMQIAQGEYIGFVDGDDWIDKDYYEKLYNNAIIKGADIARCTYKYCYPFYSEDSELNAIIKERLINDENLKINEHSVVIWNAIYNYDFLKRNKINYFDEDLPMSHDVPFTARVDFLSKKTIPVRKTYYYYRKNRKGQLIAPSLKRLQCVLEANRRVITFINSLENIDEKTYIEAYKRVLGRFPYLHNVYKNEKYFIGDVKRDFYDTLNNLINLCKYPSEIKIPEFID